MILIRNIFRFLSLLLVSSFIVSQSGLAYAATPADISIAPMLKGIVPSVVNIKAQIKITDFNTLREIQKRQQKQGQNLGDDQPVPNKAISVGSGVIVDANNGFILTNAHVINDATTVIVTLADGRHFTAKIIGIDKPSDIALLQIKAKNITAITFTDSNDVKVGDYVAAIGNPFGLSQSVTSGIVSAIGRNTLGIENYENFIQTDAPINPGNSGGALVNMQGKLIGINTAILAPSQGSVGIGFAIPSNMAKSVMNQLLQYGNVKRGVLGIGAQDFTPDLATAFNLDISNGAAVTQVLPGSPAEQGGLQVGDIITSINGTPIKNAGDVVNAVGFLRVDSKANIDVIRHGKQATVTVTLSDPKSRQELIQKRNPFLFGVAMKNFSLLSPVHGNVNGILIASVDEGSNAWNADLRPGDVITSANQHKVTSVDELNAVATKADKTLLLSVLRGGSAIFLVINKEV